MWKFILCSKWKAFTKGLLSIGDMITGSIAIQTKCNKKGLLWRTQLHFSLLKHRTIHSNLLHKRPRIKTAPPCCISQSSLPRIWVSQELECWAAAEEQMWLLLQRWDPANTLPSRVSARMVVTRWAKGLKFMPSLQLFLAQSQGLLKQEASCEVYGVYGVLITLWQWKAATIFPCCLLLVGSVLILRLRRAFYFLLDYSIANLYGQRECGE